jgi:5S rRNA maturation endonuclease (ribonuclease M5)
MVQSPKYNKNPRFRQSRKEDFRVLIVCEGEKDRVFLKKIKDLILENSHQPTIKLSGGKKLEGICKTIKANLGFDQIYGFFDTDNSGENISEINKKIKTKILPQNCKLIPVYYSLEYLLARFLDQKQKQSICDSKQYKSIERKFCSICFDGKSKDEVKLQELENWLDKNATKEKVLKIAKNNNTIKEILNILNLIKLKK